MKSQPPKRPSPDLLKDLEIRKQDGVPLYTQLTQSLRGVILNQMEDGSRFWSEAQLVKHLPVSLGTVQHALAELTAEGLLQRKRASHSFVSKPSTSPTLRHLAIFHINFSSESTSLILDFVSAHCEAHGIAMHHHRTHRGENFQNAAERLDFSPHDGAVLLLSNTTRATAELAASMQRKGYRHAIIDTLMKEIPTPFIGGSNFKGMELAMGHLTALGHRRIVLLSNEPEENGNAQERMEAFNRYVQSRPELSESWIHHCGVRFWDNGQDIIAQAMPGILDRRPTALLGISDYGALAAMKWCQQNHVSIPGDLSLMGFDGTDLSALVHPALTSLGQPYQEIVSGLFTLLEQEPTAAPARIFIAPSLMVRESTGPVAIS